MADVIFKHVVQTLPISAAEYHATTGTHEVTGGEVGTVVVFAASSPTKLFFSKSLGLNAALPVDAGCYSSILGANNVTGLSIWRFTDTSPTGDFYHFKTLNGVVSLARMDINGSATSTSYSTATVISSEKFLTAGDLGQRIRAAAIELPSTGGIVDARDATGTQTISVSATDVLSGITKPLTILLPVGTITVNSTGAANIFVLKSNQRILGSGIGLTIINADTFTSTPSNKAPIVMDNGMTDCEVGHLTFKSNGLTTNHRIAAGVLVGTTTRPYVHDVHFDLWYGSIGVYVIGATYGKFHDLSSISRDMYSGPNEGTPVLATNPGSTLVFVDNATQSYGFLAHHDIRGITEFKGGWAVVLRRADRCTVTDLYAWDDTRLSFEGLNVCQSSDCTFTNIRSIKRGDAGIIIGADNDIAGGPGGGGTNFSKRNVLSSSYVAYNHFGGIGIGGWDNHVIGCVAIGNGFEDAVSTNRQGFSVASFAKGTVLRDITAGDDQGAPTQQWGIQITAGAEDTYIEGAHLFNNVQANQIDDAGTNTHYAGWYRKNDTKRAARFTRILAGATLTESASDDEPIQARGAAAGIRLFDRTDPTKSWSIRADQVSSATRIQVHNSVAGAVVFSLTATGNVILTSSAALGLSGDTALTFNVGNQNSSPALSLTTASNAQNTGTSVTLKATSTFTGTGGTAYATQIAPTFAPTATSTMAGVGLFINPTINYSAGTPGAGGVTGILLEFTETALPTGASYFIRALRTSGSLERYSVSRLGVVSQNANAIAPPAPIGDEMVALCQADGQANRIQMESFGAASQITGRRANDTNASPDALAADDIILQMTARGYNGSAYSSAGRAHIMLKALDAWVSGVDESAWIDFQTTAINSTTTATAMALKSGLIVGLPASVTDPGAGSVNLSGVYQKAGVTIADWHYQVYGGLTVAAATTTFGVPSVSTHSASETARQIVMTVGGATTRTIRNLRVHTSNSQPAGGSLTVTIRKNAADTAVIATVAATAGAGVYADTTNSVTFANDDKLSVEFTNNDGSNASAQISSIAFEATVGGA